MGESVASSSSSGTSSSRLPIAQGRKSVIINLNSFYCHECCQYASCDHLDQNPDISLLKSDILRAVTQQGYFLVTGHNVPQHLLDQVRQVSSEFFNSTMEQKLLACSKDRARRGFSPMATENFATLVGEAGKPNDTVEKYRIGPMHPTEMIESYQDYFATKESRVHFFPNDWTNVSSLFYETSKTYYDAMFALALTICKILEFCLSLAPTSLIEETDRHTSILCYNHYPSLPLGRRKEGNGDVQVIERIAEHTDVSMFTIVTELEMIETESNKQDVDLEIYNTLANQWESVKYDPGMFLVNIGDCLSERSKNQLLSALHRVVMKCNHDDFPIEMSSKERFSTAFFFSPNYNARMNWPLKDVIGEHLEGNAVDYDTWRKDRVKRAMDKLKQSTTPLPKPPSKKAMAKAAKKKKAETGESTQSQEIVISNP